MAEISDIDSSRPVEMCEDITIPTFTTENTRLRLVYSTSVDGIKQPLFTLKSAQGGATQTICKIQNGKDLGEVASDSDMANLLFSHFAVHMSAAVSLNEDCAQLSRENDVLGQRQSQLFNIINALKEKVAAQEHRRVQLERRLRALEAYQIPFHRDQDVFAIPKRPQFIAPTHIASNSAVQHEFDGGRADFDSAYASPTPAVMNATRLLWDMLESSAWPSRGMQD